MKKGWKTETLGDTCEMYQPKTISGKDMVEDGPYLVFGANGVIGRYDKYNHEEPQLLITCRGATCGSVNVSEPKSWITGNAMVVRSRNGAIDRRFLEYLFRGGLDVSKAITGAAQPQITRTNLEPLEISYPNTLSEQHRIVRLLDEAFEGIATAKANATKNLQNARALFESHLQSVFSQRGKGWVERPLESISTIINGFAFKSTDFSAKAGVKCIKITNVGVREFMEETGPFLPPNFAGKHKAFTVTEGNIVIALTRTIIAGGLKVAVVPAEYDGALLNQRVASIVVAPHVMSDTFLFAFLSTQTVVDYVKARVNTLMQPNLSITDLRLMPIPFPPLAEQIEITNRIDALREETQRLTSLYTRKLAALEALKKSLLHRAFSGELR